MHQNHAKLDFTPLLKYHLIMTVTMILFILSVFVLASGFWLRSINLSHLRLHGLEVPPGFEGTIDAKTLAGASAYTFEKSRAEMVQSAVDNVLLLVFMFGGLLGLYDRWVSSLADSFVVNGLLFFLFLALAETLIDIPFSLYLTFRVENRYGFNTTTQKLWLTDLIKSTAISVLLLCLLVAGAFTFIRWSPGFWWLWVWGFFTVTSIFLMYIAPYVIEPLFFKFSPVEEKGLEEDIRKMMERAGVQVSRVMQVDVKFFYSHLPVVERVQGLLGKAKMDADKSIGIHHKGQKTHDTKASSDSDTPLTLRCRVRRIIILCCLLLRFI